MNRSAGDSFLIRYMRCVTHTADTGKTVLETINIYLLKKGWVLMSQSMERFEEQLENISKKKEQLNAKERKIKKLRSEEQRKARTHRLIELGAIVESVLKRETTEEDKNKLLNFLNMQERNGNYFTRAMNSVTTSLDGD